MTRISTSCLAFIAAAGLAVAVPAMAHDGYHHEDCYDRNADASAGGAVTGAIVGGAAAGPAGAIVGAAVGGSAGDDSVHCRYEDDGYAYDDDRGRDDRDRDYGSNYRDGYSDGYADASERYNGSDRGYRQDDDYYARRSSYRHGFYDGYSNWHPAEDDPNLR